MELHMNKFYLISAIAFANLILQLGAMPPIPSPCNVSTILGSNGTSTSVLQPSSDPSGGICAGYTFLTTNCNSPFTSNSNTASNCVYVDANNCEYVQCAAFPDTAQFIDICREEGRTCLNDGTKNCCPGLTCVFSSLEGMVCVNN